MIEDDVYGIIDKVSDAIAQGSDVLHVGRCDDFMSWVIHNRKDLFEVPNKLFIGSLHFSDDELIGSSYNNQEAGV